MPSLWAALTTWLQFSVAAKSFLGRRATVAQSTRPGRRESITWEGSVGEE